MMAIINVTVGRREDQQAVAQPAGLLRIVGDKHHRATGQQGGRQGLNPRTGEGIQRRVRLIHQHDGAILIQRARQRGALTHAAGESRRAGVGAG